MSDDGRASTDPWVRPHFASSVLVTIDVQRDFLSESPYGIPGTTEILPALLNLVQAYREADRPIYHVVRLYERGGANADLVRRSLLSSGTDIVAPGSPGSQLAAGLAPPGAPEMDPAMLLAGRAQRLGANEYALFKPRWGAFFQTTLEDLLRAADVDTVVIAGCNLPNCPRASLIEASERDFRLVAVVDALSRVTDNALTEIGGIGVNLLTVAAVREALGATTATGPNAAVEAPARASSA